MLWRWECPARLDVFEIRDWGFVTLDLVILDCLCDS